MKTETESVTIRLKISSRNYPEIIVKTVLRATDSFLKQILDTTYKLAMLRHRIELRCLFVYTSKKMFLDLRRHDANR